MLYDPIKERAFESDVEPGFLALNPLVLENLITLRQKLPVQGGIHDHTF